MKSLTSPSAEDFIKARELMDSADVPITNRGFIRMEYIYITFEKYGFSAIEDAEKWIEEKIAEHATEAEIIEDVSYNYANGEWSAMLSLSNES